MSNLFKPIHVGNVELKHRVVMAPLTRHRADDDHTPNDLMLEYYREHASASTGALIISEATFPSKAAGLYENTPGIYTDRHIAAWKKIITAIHESGSQFFMQLWALGRASSQKYNEKEGVPVIAPSAVPLSEPNFDSHEIAQPRAMTKTEINQLVKDYVQGSKNAIAAGADGVEIHSAHGYLLGQFLDPFANVRTDEYGGSIENRARLLLEIIDAVIDAIGAEKVAVRFSPWLSNYLDKYDVSPIPQFGYVITEIERRKVKGKGLAYIHAVEPRVQSIVDVENPIGNNNWIRTIWSGTIIRAGGFHRDTAIEDADNDDNTLIAFGRYFLSNPDLAQRLKDNKEVYTYDRATFYNGGKEGYVNFTKPRHLVRI